MKHKNIVNSSKNKQTSYVYISEKQKKRIIYTKKLYDELGTLERTAKTLKITRERVRQLLNKGEKKGLFVYEPNRDIQFRKLKETITKEVLIYDILSGKRIEEICSKNKIRQDTYYKLTREYNINTSEYIDEYRYNKYIKMYSDVVDRLGHHPSTTELQSRNDWRNLNMAIARIWGSVENFRLAFGIEKPKHAIHPNTVLAWNKRIEKAKDMRSNNINQVKLAIKNTDKINFNELRDFLGFKSVTLYNYLTELLNKGEIYKIKKKNRVWYSCKGPQMGMGRKDIVSTV